MSQISANHHVVILQIIFVVVTLINCVENIARISDCRWDKTGELVYCYTPQWEPNLVEYIFVNRSNVKSLQIDIKKAPSRMTAKHLQGLSGLETLIVRGITCHLKHCPIGLTKIDEDTFEETKEIRSLTLSAHQITDLFFLKNLTKLRFLLLKQIAFLSQLRKVYFDNLRYSVEKIVLAGTIIDELPDNVFENMPKLQILELQTFAYNLTIKTNAISNLPALESLFITCGGRFSNVTFEQFAFKNLPQLRLVSIHYLKQIEAVSMPICSGIQSVEHLTLNHVDGQLLKHCPQLLRCDICGSKPKLYPQVYNFIYPLSDTSILPNASIIPLFNVSQYSIYGITDEDMNIFDGIDRMPFLTHYRLGNELPDLFGISDTFRLTRLNEKHFDTLTTLEHLMDIRIALMNCDCQVISLIRWVNETMNLRTISDVSDILHIDCLRIANICADDLNNFITPQRSHNVWINLTLFESIVNPRCEVNRDLRLSPVRYGGENSCRCVDLATCGSSGHFVQSSSLISLVSYFVYRKLFEI